MEATRAVELLEQITGRTYRKTTQGWVGHCPCHKDRKRSLGVLQRSNGKAYFRCFAGCSARDIVQAIKSRSCFYDVTEVSTKEYSDLPPWERTPVAIYDYLDHHGQLVFQKLRFENKDFAIRRPNGRSWRWSMQGVEPVLYNLPAIIPAQIVAIVEGEKDADTLTAIGIPATTNYDGAYKGKWRTGYNVWFRDKHVMVFADEDEAGQSHAKHIISTLKEEPLLSLTFMFPLPGLSHSRDVTDWLELGYTGEDLLALWKAKRGAADHQPVRTHHCE